MTPQNALELARLTLTPIALTFLDRSRVTKPTPEAYVVIDYVSGTPVRPQFDAQPKQRLLQVTCWAKSRSAAFALQTETGAVLRAAGFREGQDRDLPEDSGYWGAQTDWRYT